MQGSIALVGQVWTPNAGLIVLYNPSQQDEVFQVDGTPKTYTGLNPTDLSAPLELL